MLLSTISSVSPADRSSSRILPEPVAATSLKLRSMAGVGIVFQFLWWRMRLDWHRVAVYDCARFAGVAQLVEQRIRNAQVMGSSPFSGSRHLSCFISPRLLAGFFVLAGCGLSAVMSGVHSVSAIFFLWFFVVRHENTAFIHVKSTSGAMIAP